MSTPYRKPGEQADDEDEGPPESFPSDYEPKSGCWFLLKGLMAFGLLFALLFYVSQCLR